MQVSTPRLQALLLTIGLGASLPASAQVSITIGSVRDATLYDVGGGELANGAGTYMFAGVTGSGFFRRALVRFDVASEVPAGSQIVDVALRLRMDMTQAGGVPISVHRVLASWGEAGSLAPGGQGGGGVPEAGDATWFSRFFPGSPWTSPGGDYTAAPSASINVGGTGNYTWTGSSLLVGDVAAWLDDPSANHGWLLRAPETQPTTAKRFATREFPTASFRPRLDITYLPPSPPASVSSVGAGCTGSSGTPFALTNNGLPSLGNASFSLSASGGPASQLAFLFFATGTGPGLPILSPTCLVFLEQSSALAFVQSGVSPLSTALLDVGGAATFGLPIPTGSSLLGVVLGMQSLAIDLGVTGSVVTSNALELQLGI